MKTTYTAITIGPIYCTMQIAESSKAIWTASYLFSHFMKQIYNAVEKEIGKENIILPYADKDLLTEKLQAGLFPDRIIFQGKLADFEKLKDNMIADLAKIIANDLKKDQESVISFLSSHLVINCVEKELPEEENAVETMNKYLDTSELFQKTNPAANETYLSDFFEMKEKGYNEFIKDEFDTQPIPSINQIATAKLNHTIKDFDNDEEKFNEAVKKQKPDKFRNFHKYIAVVQADGDNFGAFNTALYSLPMDKRMKYIIQLSKNLTEFSKKSLQIIKDWLGVPIFAGGDDLLFLAPIANVEKSEKDKYIVDKTILSVLDNIDKNFNQLFTEYNEYGVDFKTVIKGLDKKPTMSYGINISYHKYPLDQALANAYSMLKKAKEGKKNAIALQVIKHSGQTFFARFDKTDRSFAELKTIYENLNIKSDFISGFIYKLQPLSIAMQQIGLEEKEDNRNKRFQAFFKNFLDEDIHQKQQTDENSFLAKTREMIQTIYTENRLTQINADEQHKANIEKLYAGLRFYQFINAKEEK